MSSYIYNNIIFFISSKISFSNPQINIILCLSEIFLTILHRLLNKNTTPSPTLTTLKRSAVLLTTFLLCFLAARLYNFVISLFHITQHSRFKFISVAVIESISVTFYLRNHCWMTLDS